MVGLIHRPIYYFFNRKEPDIDKLTETCTQLKLKNIIFKSYSFKRPFLLEMSACFDTGGLIYVHLRAQRNQRLRQTAYSAQCVSAFYVVFIEQEPGRVISALLRPLV